MFGEILDLILFPVKELLKLLVDDRITDYLGFSPMAGIVTLLVILIVTKALVNTTYVGGGINRSIDSISNSLSDSKVAKERAKVQSDFDARMARDQAAARAARKG